MIEFLIIYILILFLSAVAINGFFNITRGRWEVQPDGTKEWTGKLLSGWSKFLQQHTVNREFYSEKEWSREFSKLTAFFSVDEIIELLETGVVVTKMSSIRKGYLASFAAVNNILYTGRDYGSGTLICVYKEVKKYKIPYIIRTPLGECLACMSSVWGTVCAVFWYQISLLVYQIHPVIGIGIFIEMPFYGLFCIWVAFCISLAYLNELFFSINSKLQR